MGKKKNIRQATVLGDNHLAERIGVIEAFLYRYGFDQDKLIGLPIAEARCGTQMQKGELIYFFHVLMDEGIWFFDSLDEKENRKQFQDFIERHFTYSGEGGRQHQIFSTSRHFSECRGFTYRKKQLAYLEKMIALLVARREDLARR